MPPHWEAATGDRSPEGAAFSGSLRDGEDGERASRFVCLPGTFPRDVGGKLGKCRPQTMCVGPAGGNEC